MAAPGHSSPGIILCRTWISELGADSGVTHSLSLSFPGIHVALSQRMESVYFNKFSLYLGHSDGPQSSPLCADRGLDAF